MSMLREKARKDSQAAPYESAMTAFAKSSFTVGAVTVGMLVAVACGRPKEEPLGKATTTSAAVLALASCDTIEDQGSCTDYSSRSGSFGVERSLCRSAHGAFRLSACATENQVGTCVVGGARAMGGAMGPEVKRYYDAGPRRFTAETAREDCEKSGGLEGRFLATR